MKTTFIPIQTSNKRRFESERTTRKEETVAGSKLSESDDVCDYPNYGRLMTRFLKQPGCVGLRGGLNAYSYR